LRREDEREAAAEVGRLRKPTVSAWTVNQLAREERRQVDLLLDAGRRLRDAHGALLGGGDPKELDRARAAQRESLRALAAAARRIAQKRLGSATEAMLERVTATLRAASVDDAGRELLALGRLTADVDQVGFEALAGLEAARPRARAKRPRGERQEDVKRLRTELEQARARRRELEQAAREAGREAEQARREWERSQAAAEQARADADEAAAAVAAAKERLERGRH
jgi:hypothetical protein